MPHGVGNSYAETWKMMRSCRAIHMKGEVMQSEQPVQELWSKNKFSAFEDMKEGQNDWNPEIYKEV